MKDDNHHLDLEILPVAALMAERGGTIISANAAATRMFGFDESDLVGIAIETVISDPRLITRGAESAISSDPILLGSGGPFRGLRLDGSNMQLDIGFAALGEGAFLILLRDRNQDSAAHKALRETEERFRVAAYTTMDLIFEADLAKDSLVWFGDIEAVLGFDPGEFPKTVTDWQVMVHPDDLSMHLAEIQRCRETGEDYAADYRMYRKDGSLLYVELRGRNIETVDGDAVRWVGALTDVTDRVLANQELQRALTEVSNLKDRIQAESTYLQQEIRRDHGFDEIVGNSAAISACLRKIELVSKTSSTVLVTGETGTGKELLARAIHSRSERSGRPLIKVDCSTLSPGLVECELFGHEKGAFTGAHESRAGRFELAHQGTIFLDEIGELPLDLQPKLLRVLEEGECQRVGSKTLRSMSESSQPPTETWRKRCTPAGSAPTSSIGSTCFQSRTLPSAKGERTFLSSRRSSSRG